MKPSKLVEIDVRIKSEVPSERPCLIAAQYHLSTASACTYLYLVSAPGGFVHASLITQIDLSLLSTVLRDAQVRSVKFYTVILRLFMAT